MWFCFTLRTEVSLNVVELGKIDGLEDWFSKHKQEQRTLNMCWTASIKMILDKLSDTLFIARYYYLFYNIKKPALDGKHDSSLNKQISDVIRSNILTMKNNIVTGDITIFRNFKSSLSLC